MTHNLSPKQILKIQRPSLSWQLTTCLVNCLEMPAKVLALHLLKPFSPPFLMEMRMDYLAVRECFKYVKEYCGRGNGPIYVELNTYRYHGHSMSDPGTTYRDRTEIGDVRESRDPIETVKKYMLDAGFAEEAELKAVAKEITKEVNEAAKVAKAGNLPPLDHLFTDIFSDGNGGSEIPEHIRMPVYEDSVGV